MIRTLMLFVLVSPLYSFAQDSLQDEGTQNDSLPITSLLDSVVLINPISVQIDSTWFIPPYIPPGCIIPLPPYYPPPWILDPGISYFVLLSPYTPENALLDIKNKKVKLLFPGGIGGNTDVTTNEAKAFSKKYKIELICQGCVRYEGDDEEGYNQLVFAYLDQLYGNSWRNELPSLPIGMEQVKAKRANLEVTQQKKKKINTVLPKATATKKASFTFIFTLGSLLLIGGIVAFVRIKNTTKSSKNSF